MDNWCKGGAVMPEKQTIERARRDKREGKSPSSQAGEFVREEIHHVREGKHGVRSTKQAIAIGLSKARRAGVKLPPPKKGAASERTRKSAARESRAGGAGRIHTPAAPSRKRSKAVLRTLRRESRAPVAKPALARQARQSARKRSAEDRSRAARRA